jgi:hypothetical protein
MNPSLPISRIINVSVILTPAAAAAQSLSNLLVMGTSPVIDTTERYREYLTLAAVATDFGTAAEEYLAASKWFAQSPQPTSLLIGRFVNVASKGGLRGGTLSAAQQLMATWNAVGALGSLKIKKDADAVGVNVTGINLTAAANMNAVAAAITAGTGWPAGTTCVWNALYNRFEIESNTTGATSAVQFLVTAGVGTDISAMMLCQVNQGGYTYAGQALETATAAATLFENMVGQKFYGLNVPSLTPDVNGPNTAQLLALAALVEGLTTKHLLVITTQEAGCLSTVSTTDILYLLKQLAYNRTFTQYSSYSAHAALSAAARLMTVNYEADNTALTLKFKQEPGVQAETLTATQAAALEGKNGNVLVSYNNDTVTLEQGVMASGNFADIITTTDWLAVTMQRDMYNVLYANTTKVPQTDSGVGLLLAAGEARCAQGVRNGMIAPGVWNNGGFGKLKQGDFMEKGFYLYAPSVNVQASADRALRKAPPIQVAVKLAGAIHSADVTINVN